VALLGHVVGAYVGGVPQSAHDDAGVGLRRELVGARLQPDDAVPLLRHVVGADVGDVTDAADRHSRLRGVLVGAGLQADHSLALLRHLVHLQVGHVAHAADRHPGLRRELVGARLQPDDAVALTQLFDGEPANVALDRPRTDCGSVEPVALTLHQTTSTSRTWTSITQRGAIVTSYGTNFNSVTGLFKRSTDKVDFTQFLARDVIYTSRAYATMSVSDGPSVCMSVTEVHWRIIANFGFKLRSKFTAHCGRGEG